MLQWDEQALYLAVLVHDDEHIQQAEESMAWSQDAVHLGAFLQEGGKQGRYEMVFAAYADRDAIVRYMTTVPANAAGADIRFKSHLDTPAGTCRYVMVFPWNRLAPFTPAPGKSFRFTLAVPDADSQPGKGFNYMSWTPGINYGKNPDDMATIVLAPIQ